MAGEERNDPGAARDETVVEAATAATSATALAEARAAQTEAEHARKAAEARTKELVAERETADAARCAAEAELAKLQANIDSANTDLATTMNEQAERGLGVREFVRQSLLGIMAGVDDAAAIGKVRALDDGIDGFLPSVTRVGATALEENVSERVEFDLAVTLSTSANEEDNRGAKAGLQVGFPGVAKFHVGASGHIERVTSEATSQDRSNRLKFSVPIVYAVQEASVDDDE